MLVCWYAGTSMMVRWYAGMLGCWDAGTSSNTTAGMLVLSILYIFIIYYTVLLPNKNVFKYIQQMFKSCSQESSQHEQLGVQSSQREIRKE